MSLETMFPRRACVWQMALTKTTIICKTRARLQMVVVFINAIYHTQTCRENIEYVLQIRTWENSGQIQMSQLPNQPFHTHHNWTGEKLFDPSILRSFYSNMPFPLFWQRIPPPIYSRHVLSVLLLVVLNRARKWGWATTEKMAVYGLWNFYFEQQARYTPLLPLLRSLLYRATRQDVAKEMERN